MKITIKPNYFIIPAITILIALIGKMLTRADQAWYWYKNQLILPEATPPDWIFPLAWNSIFILATIAALMVWNTFERSINFWAIIGLFIANGILNISWSYIFFTHHLIGLALADALVLFFVTLALMVLIAKESLITALFLIPYVVWCAFAIYLNFLILIMN